jgi:translation initiation factor IF-2
VVVAGAAYGRVRALSGAAGADVAEAGPSIAVKLVGLNAVPAAGDTFEVCATEQEARRRAEATEAAARLGRLSAQAGSSKVTTMSLASLDDEEMAGGPEGGEALQRLNIILKADAAGAVEAVQAAAGSLPQDRVALRWLLAAANEVTTSDVDLAFASDALVIGFNVTPSDAVAAAAKRAGVEIKSFAVIYDLVDDLSCEELKHHDVDQAFEQQVRQTLQDSPRA